MTTPPTFVANTVLTAAQMNLVGTWQVATATGAGTATTLSVNSCFSADYRNYRLYVAGSSSVAGNLTIQLTSSGTAAATNYYWNQVLRDYGAAPSNTVSSGGGSTTSFRLGLLNTGALGASSNLYCDIMDPFASAVTGFYSMCNYSTAQGYTTVGTHYAASSYDGFKLTGAGNLTIDVEVFGYNS